MKSQRKIRDLNLNLEVIKDGTFRLSGGCSMNNYAISISNSPQKITKKEGRYLIELYNKIFGFNIKA